MQQNLTGKTVLITGASSGIGRSTALEFAHTCPSSLKLILTARRVDRLQALQQQINSEHPSVEVLTKQLDVSKPSDIDRFWSELQLNEDFRNVDVLVNNAGFMSGVERCGDVSVEVIESVYATNIMGVIHMTQAALKIFKKRGTGDVVMLGSIAGRDPYVGGTVS